MTHLLMLVSLGFVMFLSGCDKKTSEVTEGSKKPTVDKDLDKLSETSGESKGDVANSKIESIADSTMGAEVKAPKKAGLDYTALSVPKPGSDAKEWLTHLSKIDKSMRELMRVVGSPDLPEEEALRQARMLSDMKLAAAESLGTAAKDPKDVDLAVVAKLEALAHAAGLGDSSAGSKLRLLATQKKEIQSPMLAHQANIILLGFTLSDLAAGLTDSTAVLAQLDSVLNTTETLKQPSLRVSLQTMTILEQQSQETAFATAKSKIIDAFRDNPDPSMAMQAWSLDVNDSKEMMALNESLGNADVPASVVQAALDAMVKRSPTQWTIAWLLSNVSNIEYSGKIDHASAIISTIEENLSLLTAPQLIEEAKPVIDGFKSRIGLIGNPLDFSGQKDFLTDKEFDPAVLAGKITLVDFWATWCGPCRAEFPNLRELYTKYQDKGFEIVGVNLDDKDEEVAAFFKNETLPWKHLRSLNQSLEGFANPLAEKISITAIPFMLHLDREGKVIAIHARGKRLEKLLAEYLDK